MFSAAGLLGELGFELGDADFDHAVERGPDPRRGARLQERASELERRGGGGLVAAVEVPRDEPSESGLVCWEACGARINGEVNLLAFRGGLRGDDPVAAGAGRFAGHFAPGAVRRRPHLDGLDADACGARPACRATVALALDGLNVDVTVRPLLVFPELFEDPGLFLSDTGLNTVDQVCMSLSITQSPADGTCSGGNEWFPGT